MKRVVVLLLVLITVIGALPYGVYAANQVGDPDIIWLEDGSYIEVLIETSPARVANTVTGSKKLTYRNSGGDALWQAKLTATFAYSGAWYTCATANCTVTIYDSHWYEVSNSTIRSSNHAKTYLTMGRKHLGVTVQELDCTIELTCDINGNLS